ncbi:MAG: M48 family metalloprotease [Anaerolineae bacterium]|nr:M48 family metalloprotease [Anaerolineae bacterium]MCA9889580.1 M48 family metalloprotease [Anaerolineae bacterium]MCA9893775.1 M48 family metalloprotease [Anaerolineae bacterium]MCB9458831.1 M48 family metalloprotease [Anaerolineaceae bacterium]
MSPRSSYGTSRSFGTSRSSGGSRIIIAIVLAVFALISYLSSQDYNEVTGETQYINLTQDQEIALGLQSAPEMISEFGGISRDVNAQSLVQEVGNALVRNSVAANTNWRFSFTLLEDDTTVNAFALPGGPVFITEALYSALETEDQLAGVLGHEIGHVLARHSAARIAQSELTNGLIGAVLVAGGDSGAATAQMVGQMITMKFGRDDELQSDRLGVCIMADAGYNPEEMVRVMEILEQASGGARAPEFASTHPSPENRISQIQNMIANIDQCPGRNSQ